MDCLQELKGAFFPWHEEGSAYYDLVVQIITPYKPICKINFPIYQDSGEAVDYSAVVVDIGTS
jgi:hypothetical protein